MTKPQEDILPIYGASSLCFDKDYFMQDAISVDAFVRLHQSSGGIVSLETLRDDLGLYLKILRSAMIELINRDYADFVNLSTNLIGLDRSIEALRSPLSELREEVQSVEKLLSDAIATTSIDLEKRSKLTKQKVTLQRLAQISDRLDRLESLVKCDTQSNYDSMKTEQSGNLVDRLALEVNHLNFLVTQCEGATLLGTFKPRVDTLCHYVEVGLDRCLREGLIKKDINVLRRILGTYASLGSISKAHSLIRDLIKHRFEDVITEHSLKSDPLGLSGVYKEILLIIDELCSPLLSITVGKGSVIHGYAFLEESVWPEIVTAFENRLQSIFNPGNPSLFHERYLVTLTFLDSFESKLKTFERVEEFRKSKSYEQFMHLWNLPVYFQIRYQEIGQVVECGLCEDDMGLTSIMGSGKEFCTASSQIVWDSLLRCYSGDIFLFAIVHRFWKLTLLIFARYLTFANGVISNLQEETGKNTAGKNIPTTYHPTSFHVTSQGSGYSSREPSKLVGLEASVAFYHDLQLMSQKISGFYSSSLERIFQHLPADKTQLIKDTLDDESLKISKLTNSLSKIIIDLLSKQFSSTLKQVADTPRLYRRTNRASPSSHQPYVSNAVKTINKFSTDFSHLIPKDVIISWISSSSLNVAQQYYNLTYEVLSSVHKMEESLRRLKKARDRGVQQSSESNAGLSDDDKIRLQIYLDVQYFNKELECLELDTTGIEPLKQLLKMVEDAKSGQFVP